MLVHDRLGPESQTLIDPAVAEHEFRHDGRSGARPADDCAFAVAPADSLGKPRLLKRINQAHRLTARHPDEVCVHHRRDGLLWVGEVQDRDVAGA